MNTHRIPTIIHDDGGEQELPFKYEICPSCGGHGKSSAHLGAMSAEEVREQGDEFLDDWIAGVYDQPCERCDRSGKVKVADLQRMSELEAQLYLAQTKELDDLEAEEAMERALGA